MLGRFQTCWYNRPSCYCPLVRNRRDSTRIVDMSPVMTRHQSDDHGHCGSRWGEGVNLEDSSYAFSSCAMYLRPLHKWNMKRVQGLSISILIHATIRPSLINESGFLMMHSLHCNHWAAAYYLTIVAKHKWNRETPNFWVWSYFQHIPARKWSNRFRTFQLAPQEPAL